MSAPCPHGIPDGELVIGDEVLCPACAAGGEVEVPAGSGTASASGTSRTPSDLPGSGGSGGSASVRGATGARLLDEIEAFLLRFVAFPSPHAGVAVALWCAHAHVLDVFESTPRLAFLSPEPASGKTRALETVDLLVPYPMHAVNATPAALFRAVGDLEKRPTICFDEIDTVFGPKAKENEELRGLLNAGHRRSGVAYRCQGEGTKQQVVAFPAYAAVALAGLGHLPDTILTRAVIVRMRRRAPGERVEPFRSREAEPEGHVLRERLAAWLKREQRKLRDARPTMPPGVEDRPADVWEPLLAIADAAGGAWPGRARAACLALLAEATPSDTSLGIRLLSDLRGVWGHDERVSSEELLRRLVDLEEAPWADLRGRPLNPRGLARMLRDYEVVSTKVKLEGRAVQGYRREDLHDAWLRYLPALPPPSQEAEPAEPPEPRRSQAPPEVPLPLEVPEPADPAGACQLCAGPLCEADRSVGSPVCSTCELADLSAHRPGAA